MPLSKHLAAAALAQSLLEDALEGTIELPAGLLAWRLTYTEGDKIATLRLTIEEVYEDTDQPIPYQPTEAPS